MAHHSSSRATKLARGATLCAVLATGGAALAGLPEHPPSVAPEAWPALRAGPRTDALKASAGPDAAEAIRVRPRPRDLPARIREVPHGGSDAWDRVVGGELVTAFDDDGSGAIDTPAEVERMSCDVWRALDDGVREGWGRSIWVVYGFSPSGQWVGSVIGIDEVVREAVAGRMRACDLDDDSPAVPPTAETLPTRITALPAGGSNPWDATVRQLLLSVHDTDLDGRLDGPEELDAISCETWRAMDEAVRPAWPSGLAATYGLGEDLLWLGDALGIAVTSRTVVAKALERCGLAADPSTSAPVGPEVLTTVMTQLPSAGSEAWSRFVGNMLLRVYDTDQDGQLGSTPEIRAIPCDVWGVMDRVVRAETGTSVYEHYGFDPDRRWYGHVLGFPGAARAIAADRLITCGLTPEGTALVAVVSQARLHEDLAPHDLDRSGLLDRVEEVRAVPCRVWRRLDRASRRQLDLGVTDAWGLAPDAVFTGHAVGLSPAVRDPTLEALGRCRLRR